ncbi:hypothetical protein J7T55_005785 [Diaporthe amygdali]|uniref:uncharacterized protein n=1 Tax=Phomopsis amygdali TaxID=1214568 RepID=UPI0022FE0BAA|nr:uncharacterized protein J7T55_005785 [Diaporthe amygdali]KAJ0124447.1 hypothetical protein J7T55_005785 [Diaporthe amygdali]
MLRPGRQLCDESVSIYFERLRREPPEWQTVKDGDGGTVVSRRSFSSHLPDLHWIVGGGLHLTAPVTDLETLRILNARCIAENGQLVFNMTAQLSHGRLFGYHSAQPPLQLHCCTAAS